MSHNVGIVLSAHNTGVRAGAVAEPLNLEAIAARYEQDRASFLQFMQTMARQVHDARAESARTQALAIALNNRVTAMCSERHALEAQVASQSLENQSLQRQTNGCRSEVSQLRERVDEASRQNESLQSQRQEAERSAALIRQRLERELQASRDAQERARLEAELAECHAALTSLDREEAEVQNAIGSMGVFSGAVWGAVFAGPIGAAIGAAAGGAASAGVGASDAAEKNAAKRGQLNEQIQAIKDRLLVLPQPL